MGREGVGRQTGCKHTPLLQQQAPRDADRILVAETQEENNPEQDGKKAQLKKHCYPNPNHTPRRRLSQPCRQPLYAEHAAQQVICRSKDTCKKDKYKYEWYKHERKYKTKYQHDKEMEQYIVAKQLQ